MSNREEILRVLAENGIGTIAPCDFHSWRCEHPAIYGACTCLDDLVTDLLEISA